MARNCGEKPHQHSTRTHLKKTLLSLLKFTSRRGSQLSRAQPHHCSLAAARSNQPARPQKPATAQPAPQALPTANPRKSLLASKRHGRKKPRRPFPPPTKHLTLTQHLGQTAQLPHRSYLSRKNDRSSLTVSQPQPSTRLIFKVLRFSGCAAAQLACDGLASAFTSPKSFVLAASGFSFRLQRASSPAQPLLIRRESG